jgi:hypothetical protein
MRPHALPNQLILCEVSTRTNDRTVANILILTLTLNKSISACWSVTPYFVHLSEQPTNTNVHVKIAILVFVIDSPFDKFF